MTFGRKPAAKTAGWGRWKRWSRTFAGVSDANLWQFRLAAGKSLVAYARERLSRQLAASGASPEAVDEARHLFDPNG